MNDAKIQQIGDPLTVATKPATELVARFMGDNNILKGTVARRDGDRLVVDDGTVRVSVVAGDDGHDVGDEIVVAIRAAAVTLDSAAADVNTADCEIVFVEFLGDLVKLHLQAGEERLLAKVPGEQYASLRGREGETIRIAWKEEDVQLLRP